MINAIVFVLTRHLVPDASQCMNYSLAQGYHVVGVVRDNFSNALEYLSDGRATIVVVASLDHLDTDHGPRIEVAPHHIKPRNAPPSSSRRTSRINRRDAGA